MCLLFTVLSSAFDSIYIFTFHPSLFMLHFFVPGFSYHTVPSKLEEYRKSFHHLAEVEQEIFKRHW